MNGPLIISTYLSTDGVSSGARAAAVLASRSDLRCLELKIQSLGDGWEARKGFFKSGAGPIFAIEEAQSLIQSGQTDLVLISGHEPLRSGYERAERNRLMDIYQGSSLPEAYTRVAEAFMARNGWSVENFGSASRALERNYRKTAAQRGISANPTTRDDEMVTDLFRRIDCANPVLDFEGELLLGSESAARSLGIGTVRVLATATETGDDGPEFAPDIAEYQALKRVIQEATAGLNLDALVASQDAVLELYTCFPVVPLAFIQQAGWAQSADEITAFLDRTPITVSGGMNLGRAPWNNPALRGLILVYREMVLRKKDVGVVHGNGGLGGLQGVCVLANG